MIEEFLAEGGISRFLVLVDIQDLPETLGPVRSLRSYFLEAAQPWASLLLFAGGSPEALDAVRVAKHLTYYNGLAHKEFTRDPDIAAPHNLFIAGNDIPVLASGAALHAVTWPPYSVNALSSGTDAQTVKMNFYSRIHNVIYTYEPDSRTYERLNGTVVSAMHPANIVILAAPITAIGEKGRLTIPLDEGGELLLFRSGIMQRGWWRKQPGGAWEFLDEKHEPLSLNPGQTWLTVLPDLRRVTWE